MDPKRWKFSIWYIVVALWLLSLFQIFVAPIFSPTEIPYSEFKDAVKAGKVAEVLVSSAVIHGRMRPKVDGDEKGRTFDTVRVEDTDLIKDLMAHNVKVVGVIENTFLRQLLSWLIPIALFFAVWFFLMRRLGQGQGGFMTVGQSKAKIYM